MKKKLFILFGVLLIILTQFSGNTKGSELEISEIPESFVFDGCSMFPNGDYLDCCTEHDKAYFFGGTWQERLKADNKLSVCVQNKGGLGHTLLGPAMWAGVRIGGAPLFPTSFRWGFGRDRY